MTKKIYLTLLSIFLSLVFTYAQLSQTVTVSQPGTLSQSLGDNKTKVTDLILLGTINAQDFETIKQMSALKNLDMAGVNIDNNTIPNNAFQGRVMDKIILPEGLKRIGDNSFRSASLSSSLVLPSTVEVIGSGAFHSMKSKVDFSQTKNSLKSIGFEFVGNYTLDSVLDFSDFQLLKDFVTHNGRSTFLNYRGHVILPVNLDVLPSNIFGYYEGSVSLPEGLKRLGDNSFRSASLPSTLVLPSTVEIIGSGAFHSMKSKVDFSQTKNSLKSIGFEFVGNYTLDSVLDFSDFQLLKDFVTHNGRGTFLNYRGHVILPVNLDVLPNNIFGYYEGSVSLPEGLKRLGDNSFRSASLPSILVLPSTVEIIGSGAFHSMKSKVDFSQTKNSLKSIGFEFVGNYTLDSVLDFSDFQLLKDFVTHNGRGTFLNYRGHVILPVNLDVLPNNIFGYYEGSVSLPEGLKRLGDNSFRSASLPSTLVLPSTVEIIGSGAFHSMKSKVDFSQTKNSLKSIGFEFVGNYTLDSVLDFSDFQLLKDFVTHNGRGTFLNYRGHVILPVNLDVLPNNIFGYYEGSVSLPEGLKTIGIQAFNNSTIKRIDLPSSVTSIAQHAFNNCSKLEEIWSRNTIPPVLGLNVFYGVDKETCKLQVPGSSIHLYQKADQWKDFLITASDRIELVYNEVRGNNVLTANYTGVRVGEYYWMNNNFNSPEYRAEKLATGELVFEGEYSYYYENLHRAGGGQLENYFYTPNNKAGIDKGFIDWDSFPTSEPDFWSYPGVTLELFDQYHGQYCTPTRIDYMTQYGKMLEKGNVVSSWKLPTENDLRQLVGMCGFGISSHEVFQYIGFSHDDPNAPALAQIAKGNYPMYFHNPVHFENPNLLPTAPFSKLNNNKFGFNMVANGSRKEFYQVEWVVNWQAHLAPGSYKQLGQTSKLQSYNATLVISEDVNLAYPETLGARPSEWHTVRWCRPLTDEELGYKLYINRQSFTTSSEEILLKSIGKTKQLHPDLSLEDIIDDYANVDIIKLGVRESAPSGYSELPKGLVRGYYVQFLLEGASTGKSVTDILVLATNNVRMWREKNYNMGVDLISSTRMLNSTDISLEDNTISIYPNPVQEVLNINSESPILSVEIYSLNGTLVLRQALVNGSVDVNALPSGAYVVKIQTQSSSIVRRMMKK